VNIQEESIHKYDIFETTAVGKPEGTFVRWTCYFGEIQWEPKPSNEIEESMYIDFENRPTNNALACAVFDKLHQEGIL
jgi:hypothetical protein